MREGFPALYGMNFRNMPELENGYWVVLGVALASTAATYWYFKKRKWF